MQYREDKRSGNKLSVLGFGCMRFPSKMGKPVLEESEKLVVQAVEAGINYFDTAYLYGGSEEVLGEALRRNGLREKVYIATKLPHVKCRKPEDFDELFQTSLDRLQTTYIDYYLIHNITSFQQWERIDSLGAGEWLAAQKAAGTVRQAGFSFHGPLTEFKKMLDAYPWDFVQIQYNYINEHYQAGVEGLHLAAERGLPVIIMEPLLGGRLADSLPPKALKVFQETEPDSSAASWGLRWLWNQPEVTVVLSGMNSRQQLEDNIAVAGKTEAGSLTAEQVDTIARAKAVFEESFRVPCTGCNYCMPCPKGINIPAAFASYNESFSLGWFTGIFHYFIAAGVPNDVLHFTSDCVECGACVRKCPQGIQIPQELKTLRKRLQPPGAKGIAKAFSKLSR